MKKALNGLMAVCVIAALLCAAVIAVVKPETVNYYENRPAESFPAFSASDALSGDYQDALESALHDQIPTAQLLEEQYQNGMNALILKALFAQSETRSDAYYQFNNLMLFHGDIVYAPVDPAEKMGELSAKAKNLNLIFAEHPELSFYVFYIEKDTDMDFETNTPTGFGRTALSMLWLPDDHKAVHEVKSFEDFRENFFRTDHHWNRFGSYAGYLHLMKLLGKTDPITPRGTRRLTDDFCGAKAITSGAAAYFSEPFDVYVFDFPPMDITVNGFGPADYGRQSIEWDEEEFGPPAYGAYYGFDEGEVAFHTHNIGAGNLLVIGESFDNAILKLLASHFENLYSVDLRAYEEDMHTPFRFSEYVEAHDIDSVLFIGNIDFFQMDVFDVEG